MPTFFLIIEGFPSSQVRGVDHFFCPKSCKNSPNVPIFNMHRGFCVLNVDPCLHFT